MAPAPESEAEYNQNLSYPGSRGRCSQVTEFKNWPALTMDVSEQGQKEKNDTDFKEDAQTMPR